ncbi:hypothetical protein OS493_018271 [Desmophyllum pertusum]|uniref:Kinesin light chain n=1 Tax=Desmophyllum pertusum TaxID=174260 RepID=A0A9W9YF51_9CNID|nr:hypothetical protein OS493_018271 [Desmophyllum pertusum]
MGDDINAALVYHYKALEIRLKLLGNHADTALSSYCLGNTESAVNNHAGALQSHQRALDIRMKLLGDHTDTVTAYLAVIADLGKLGDTGRMKELKLKCDEMQRPFS